MLKRNAAVVVVVGLVLAGAAVAWAGDGPERPTVLAAAQSTATTTPGTTAAPLTPEQRQARREALRTCLEQAGEDRAARQACFEAAGPGAKRFARRHGPGRGPGHGIPGALGRAVHGEVIVPDGNGGWQQVTFDRGRVDAATDESRIVLDRPDGPEVSLALTAGTRYHGIEGAADIVEGRPALVVSKDGKATHVVQKDPDRMGPGGNNPAPGDVPND